MRVHTYTYTDTGTFAVLVECYDLSGSRLLMGSARYLDIWISGTIWIPQSCYLYLAVRIHGAVAS